MLRLTPVAIALAALFLGGRHVAEGQLTREQIQQNRERIAAHFVSVHGSRAPEAIPYAQKMLTTFHILAARRSQLGDEAFVTELGARFAGTSSQQRTLDDAVRQTHSVRAEI